MKNIEIFDECVGLIFAYLVSNFPYKIMLKTTDIVALKEDTLKNVDSDFISECVEFLADEGFIIYRQKSPANDAFSFCRLSLKALVALKQEPKTLKNGKSIAQKLSEGLEDVTFGSFQSLAANILTDWAK